jgi:hypothetical protein
MTTTNSKIWLTASAFAIAAAATLTPVVAQAAPADDTDSSAVGDSAGTPAPRRAARPVSRGQADASATAPAAGPSRSSVAGGGAPAAGATGSNPLFQNPLWWFGPPNLNAPTPAYTRTFNPLASLPGWTTAYNGWYSNMNFEACVLGLSNTTVQSAGPYGTATNSVSTGGC